MNVGHWGCGRSDGDGVASIRNLRLVIGQIRAARAIVIDDGDGDDLMCVLPSCEH